MKLMGLEYEVTTRTGLDGRTVYELRGKRGACYFTMRNKKWPEMMFLCNANGFGLPCGFERVWLTDADGTLKEAR
jgi:hypothetical protein